MASKGVVREGEDLSSSHSDPDYEVPPGAWWEGSRAKKGASRTFANGRPIMRVGDLYHPHVGWKNILAGDPPVPTQVPDQHSNIKAAEGSSSVSVEGKAVHLVGNMVQCKNEMTTSKAETGSRNVFAAQ